MNHYTELKIRYKDIMQWHFHIYKLTEIEIDIFQDICEDTPYFLVTPSSFSAEANHQVDIMDKYLMQSLCTLIKNKYAAFRSSICDCEKWAVEYCLKHHKDLISKSNSSLVKKIRFKIFSTIKT